MAGWSSATMSRSRLTRRRFWTDAGRAIGEVSAAHPHPLAELLPLLGGHRFPPLVHPAAPSPGTAMPAKTAEENPAQHQQAEGLPVGDGAPSDYRQALGLLVLSRI